MHGKREACSPSDVVSSSQAGSCSREIMETIRPCDENRNRLLSVAKTQGVNSLPNGVIFTTLASFARERGVILRPIIHTDRHEPTPPADLLSIRRSLSSSFSSTSTTRTLSVLRWRATAWTSSVKGYDRCAACSTRRRATQTRSWAVEMGPSVSSTSLSERYRQKLPRAVRQPCPCSQSVTSRSTCVGSL